MDRIIHFFMTFLLIFAAVSVRALPRVTNFKNNSIVFDFESKVYLVTPFQDEKENIRLFKSRFSFTPFDVIITDRNQLPEMSTGDIVKALRGEKQKVSLFCMGRAAADCLEVFIQYPQLHQKVGQVVSFRGHVRGATFAENSADPIKPWDLKNTEKMPLIKALRMIQDSLVRWVDGFEPAVYAMRPDVRGRYLKENHQQIHALSQKVDLISIEVGEKSYGVIPFSRRIKTVSN